MRNKLLLLALCALTHLVAARENPGDWVNQVGAHQTPTGQALYQVTAYGACPDGQTLNTTAIQRAIDDCSTHGGGTVTFAPGRYLTGSLFVKNNVHLHIPRGVTLLGSTNIDDYAQIDTRVAGIEMQWPAALLNVQGQQCVKISGHGTVHAQGKIFWDKYWQMRREYTPKGLRWIVDYDCQRPRTLLVSRSSQVTIQDLTFQQAGFWTIQLLYSAHCTVSGVTIQNNIDGHGPSTDGIDIDSSRYILVEECDIDCNDDNFCLKAGRDADGLRVNLPTEYVVIRNSLSRKGGGLLTCGSETSGSIRYILAENLTAQGTNNAVNLKSAANRGGVVEYIYVRNLHLKEVNYVFRADVNWNPTYSYSTLPPEYEGKPLPPHWTKMLEPVDPVRGTPHFRHIYVSDLIVDKAKTFCACAGTPISLLEDFHIQNIRANVETTGSVRYAKGWQVKDMHLQAADHTQLVVSEGQ